MLLKAKEGHAERIARNAAAIRHCRTLQSLAADTYSTDRFTDEDLSLSRFFCENMHGVEYPQ